MFAGADPCSAALGTRGGGAGTQPAPPRAPVAHPCAPRPGQRGAGSRPRSIAASGQGVEAAPSPFRPPPLSWLCFCQGGDSGGSHQCHLCRCQGGGSGGDPRDFSRFTLEEMRAEQGSGQQLQQRTRRSLFALRAVGAVPWLSWHSSRPLRSGDAISEAGQWEGAAGALLQPLPAFSAVIQKLLSAPTWRDFGAFLCAIEKEPCAGGERSLLRPCCDLGAAARDAAGGTEGRYSRRCPASRGARLHRGLRARPWYPSKEKRHGGGLKGAPPERTRPSASCGEARVLTGDPGAPAEPLSPWGKKRL